GTRQVADQRPNVAGHVRRYDAGLRRWGPQCWTLGLDRGVPSLPACARAKPLSRSAASRTRREGLGAVLAGGSDLRYGGTGGSAVVGLLFPLTPFLGPPRPAPPGRGFPFPRRPP